MQRKLLRAGVCQQEPLKLARSCPYTKLARGVGPACASAPWQGSPVPSAPPARPPAACQVNDVCIVGASGELSDFQHIMK